MYVCDFEGFIVWYNRRAADIWGQSPQIGESIGDLCASLRLFRSDGQEFAVDETPMATVLRAGEPARDQEIVIERPDGSRVYILVNIDPLRNADGRQVGAINCFVDITDRRTLQQDLEDFFENAAIALHSVASDGTIVRANRAELDLLGYTAEEYVGRHIAEFHVDRGAVDELLARLGRGEAIENHEARLRARDGSIRHVLVTSNPQLGDDKALHHTRCFTIDITDRKDLQERLLLAQELGGIGTFERDIAAGTMRVSRQYWQMFGVEPDAFPLTHEGWLARVHPDDHVRVLRDQDTAFSNGGYETQYRAIWPDGQVRWLHTRGWAETDPEGKPLRITGAIVDTTEQKAEEAALRRQESELRRVTDSIPALVAYVDAKQRFRLANRAYVEWFGRARGEIEGHHVREVLGEAGYEIIRPQLERVLGGEPVRYESRRTLADGSERLVDASYVPRFGRNGRVVGFYSFVNDVTERDRTLTELRARTALLEAVLDVVPVAVWVSESGDGSAIFGSGYAARLFRVPPEENLSLTPGEGNAPRHWHFHKDGVQLPLDQSPLRRALRGEVVRGEQLDLVYDDGTRVTLLVNSAPIPDPSGKPGGAVAAAMDISERARTDETLRARSAELEGIMDTVPAIVWLARGARAEHIEGSRYVAELLRMRPGQNQSRTAPPDRKPTHFRLLRDGAEVPDAELPLQRAARGEDIREDELEIVFEDGETVPILLNASPLRDKNGNIVGSLGAGIDIRERKRAEERQTLLTAELDHRVKNMLATVQGMIVRTADGRRSTEDFTKSLNGRIRAMSRAHEQLAENRWEGVDLHILVENELRPYATRHRTRIDGPDLVLSAKAATSLALVLHELSTNAVKYGALSSDGGNVAIAWQLRAGRAGGKTRILRLRWAEAGGPPVAEPHGRGFGSTLIERVVAYEFDAEVSLRWEKAGLQATFDIPLDRVIARPSRPATVP